MSPFALVLAALRALAANRVRSALTVVSITTGTFAIVLMSSLAASGLATLRKGTEDLGGARLLMVAARAPVRAESKADVFPKGFRVGDAARLSAGVPHVIEGATFSTLDRVDATTDTGRTARTNLVAADATFIDVFRLPLARGRAFTVEEDRAHAPVCLVASAAAKKLWPAGDALGHLLTVGAARCKVVGLLANPQRYGIDFGFDWTDFVVLPLETLADTEPRVRTESALVFKTDAAVSNEIAKRVLNARLVEARHGVDDFSIYDFAQIMARFDAVFAIMQGLVGVLAGIALVVGGVGVMTMTLVGVTERTREIGLRRALGARRADVARQFLVEAVLLAGAGGSAGVLLGVVASVGAGMAIARALPVWQGEVARGAALVALGVAFGIGAVFGWGPARRAAGLDPVAALRG